VNISRKWEEMW